VAPGPGNSPVKVGSGPGVGSGVDSTETVGSGVGGISLGRCVAGVIDRSGAKD
jgi:hypothetical protein